jgi:hypothetical protein
MKSTDLMNRLTTEIGQLAQQQFKQYGRQTVTIAFNAIVNVIQQDQQQFLQWQQQLQQGLIDAEEVQWLLEAKQDLIDLQILQQQGLKQIEMDRFVNNSVELILKILQTTI